MTTPSTLDAAAPALRPRVLDATPTAIPVVPEPHGALRSRSGRRLRAVKDSTENLRRHGLSKSSPPDLPDAAAASSLAQPFRVANVRTNGRIYLRPIQHARQQSQPLPYSTARRNNSSVSFKHAVDLAVPHTRSASASSAAARSLRIRIDHNEAAQAARTTLKGARASFLEIPIPSGRLGRPRFSARGSAFFSLSSYRTSLSNGGTIDESSEWSLGDYTGQFPVPPTSRDRAIARADPAATNRDSTALPTIQDWKTKQARHAPVSPTQPISVDSVSIHAFHCFGAHWGVRRLIGSVKHAWKTQKQRLLDTKTRPRTITRRRSITLCGFNLTGRDESQRYDEVQPPPEMALRHSRSAPGLAGSLEPGQWRSDRVTSNISMGSRSIIIMDGTDTNNTAYTTARASRQFSPRDTYLEAPSVVTEGARSSQGGQMVPLYFDDSDEAIYSPGTPSATWAQDAASASTPELLGRAGTVDAGLSDILGTSASDPQLRRRQTRSSFSLRRRSSTPSVSPRQPMSTFESHETLRASAHDIRHSQIVPDASYMDMDDSGSEAETHHETRQPRGLRRLPGGNLRKAEVVQDLHSPRDSYHWPASQSQDRLILLSTTQLQDISEEAADSLPSAASTTRPLLRVSGDDWEDSAGAPTFLLQSRPQSMFQEGDGNSASSVDPTLLMRAYSGEHSTSLLRTSSQIVEPLAGSKHQQQPAPKLLPGNSRDAPMVPYRSSSRSNLLAATPSVPDVPQRSSSCHAFEQQSVSNSDPYSSTAPELQRPPTHPLVRPSLSVELAAIADLPDSDDDDGGVEAALAKLEGRASTDISANSSMRSSREPAVFRAASDVFSSTLPTHDLPPTNTTTVHDTFL